MDRPGQDRGGVDGGLGDGGLHGKIIRLMHHEHEEVGVSQRYALSALLELGKSPQ